MNKRLIKKIGLFIAAALVLGYLYHTTALGDYLTLTYMQQQSSHFKTFVDTYYWFSVLVYMLIFITTVALSIPSSVLLTLLGGYLFGVFYGTLFATISVGIGIAIAYMFLKFFFHTTLMQAYAHKAERFENAIQSQGVSYLLMLHFSAVVPYFMINTFAILSKLSLCTVVWTGLVGFLPQAVVYAFAGKGFASMQRLSDIFSYEIVIAFILLIVLASLPIVLRRYRDIL